MMKAKMAGKACLKSCMTKEQSEKPGADFFGAPGGQLHRSTN
jgi:hypothetical protein